ncbi:DUF7344 domain-containing protein [Natronococcus occultus]|uniref:DUF7344 domain-containing protein n=1 Tax=Natronococcus occultus SP4 TaxID=694430 RepID=L0K147_9EURY|nr:hypothetical protein [Natronococcus occultus]AGB38721.1 hypothetical protein Natoc_2966 [Natronococcus occultus SP4]
MQGRQLTDILVALRDGRRRALHRLLRNRTAPIPIEEAAVHLAARGETRLVDVTEAEMRSLRVSLGTAHVPVLVAAGLVDRDREDGTLAASDHPALQHPNLERILETETVDWDPILDALASDRRRTALSVLADAESALSRVALARAVADREADGEPTPDAVDDCRIELHHVHLPKLAAAGLITSDRRGDAVSYRGHPALEDGPWFDFGAAESRGFHPVANPSQDIRRIDGRENVIERCRALCAHADEELFLMYTDEDLIEEACLQYLQDAVDRGVEVYVGTRTQAIRDRVREHVPAVTLWEPQRNWMNMPPERETVGRLVFADREAIMLGTLSERNERGIQDETAITGVGENNALVMLIRELLGSRLDHLDEQSEDFLEQIPF